LHRHDELLEELGVEDLAEGAELLLRELVAVELPVCDA
jgi:hypothetical protein